MLCLGPPLGAVALDRGLDRSAPRRPARAKMAPRRSHLERALDAVHDALAPRCGFFEMMRLAQTSKALRSTVCSRARELDDSSWYVRDGEKTSRRKVSAKQLVPLLRRCVGLRRILLIVADAGDELILPLAAHCTRLESLAISYRGGTGCTDSGVAVLARVHTNLAELDLRGQTALTDDALRSIAQHLPMLKFLDLNGCSGITDAGVIELAQSCTSLKAINITSTPVTHVGTSAIARNCPLLEKFIAVATAVNDEAIITLAQWCPKLNHFALQGARRASITDAALSALAAGDCPLHRLFIAACRNVTDAGVATLLPKWKTAPNVQLCLNGTGITVASVLAIAANVPNLAFLAVQRARHCHVTDEALCAVAHGCPIIGRDLATQQAAFTFDPSALVSQACVKKLETSHPGFRHSMRPWVKVD